MSAIDDGSLAISVRGPTDEPRRVTQVQPKDVGYDTDALTEPLISTGLTAAQPMAATRRQGAPDSLPP